MATDYCYLGDDFDIHFPAATDVLGNAVSLVGAALYCDVQQGSSSVVAAAATYINEADNTSRARFTSAQTAAFVAGKAYAYDGRVVLASGEIHTIGKGSFVALAAKTPTP